MLAALNFLPLTNGEIRWKKAQSISGKTKDAFIE
jgi:hypothetical protein